MQRLKRIRQTSLLVFCLLTILSTLYSFFALVKVSSVRAQEEGNKLPPGTSVIFSEDFNDGVINQDVWRKVECEGLSTSESGGKLNVNIPSGPTPQGGGCGGVETWAFLLAGDFDIRVDFYLPPDFYDVPGARIKMEVSDAIGGGGNGFLVGVDSNMGYTSEDKNGQFFKASATNTLEGTLRITRIGSKVTTYYLDANTQHWILHYSWETSLSGNLGIDIGAWNNPPDYSAFSAQFDNVIAFAGEISSWEEYNGHYYHIALASTWAKAQTLAESVGGNLATLNDRSEENWLRATFGDDDFWIGYNDITHEANWQWVSGEFSAYENWCPGEPNNSTGSGQDGEDVGVMNWFAAPNKDCWNDEPNQAYYKKSIIEIGTTPELLLPQKAAELAKAVLDKPYLSAAKGYDSQYKTYLGPTQIGYDYWHSTKDGEVFGKSLDCSGLVMWSYDRANNPLEHPNEYDAPPILNNFISYEGADRQFRLNTEPTTEEELQPGDLLFYRFSDKFDDDKKTEELEVSFTDGIAGKSTGKEYSGPVRIQISGVGKISPGQQSDAFYIFEPAPPTHIVGEWNMSLKINGKIPEELEGFILPAYNSNNDHAYDFIVVLPKGKINFSVGDANPGDNDGKYTVTVTQTGATHVNIYVGDYQAEDYSERYTGTFNLVNASQPGDYINPESLDDYKAKSGFISFRHPVSPTPAPIKVVVQSPVDLIVTDPEGYSINSETLVDTGSEVLRTVLGQLYYSEQDIDDDGELEDIVYAPELKEGDYTIQVEPEDGASPDDTYSLEVTGNEEIIVLAEDVAIADIPENGYSIISKGGNISTSAPRYYKLSAIDLLQEVDVESRPLMNKIINAVISKIEASLNESYWLDDLRLDSENGDEVFRNEEKAALLCPTQGWFITEELKNACGKVEENLVAADDWLAQVSIDDVRDVSVINPDNQACYDSMLNLSDKAINLARKRDLPELAIPTYRASWKLSQRAIKYAESQEDICSY